MPHPPEMLHLRRALRNSVAVDVAARQRHNSRTATSATEMADDIARMTAAGEVQRAKLACERAGIKIPKDSERLAIRQTKHGWITADGRRVTKSKLHKNTGWVNAPAGSAWDPDLKAWI